MAWLLDPGGAGFEPVLVEHEWHDGPRVGLALVGGRPDYFRVVDDGDDDEYLVWPATAESVVWEREQWLIFVEWNDRYEAGLVDLGSHPGNDGVDARYDELTRLLADHRRAPFAARRWHADWRSRADRPGRRYTEDGPDYEVRWREIDRPEHSARQLGEEAMRRLRRSAVCAIEPGLTDEEFARIEQEFGFEFADDHRAFLAAGLPVNRGMPPREPGVIATRPWPWPDWRLGDPGRLRQSLGWPVEGVLFDVEHNAFWPDGWGARPESRDKILDVAQRHLAAVPQMVPVYGHRYLPSGRGTSGHPVLSMYQTDIIYYGLDLAHYIDVEFMHKHPSHDPWPAEPLATVEFWRDLL